MEPKHELFDRLDIDPAALVAGELVLFHTKAFCRQIGIDYALLQVDEAGLRGQVISMDRARAFFEDTLNKIAALRETHCPQYTAESPCCGCSEPFCSECGGCHAHCTHHRSNFTGILAGLSGLKINNDTL